MPDSACSPRILASPVIQSGGWLRHSLHSNLIVQGDNLVALKALLPYYAGCLLGRDRLQAARVIVRQTPYEIKVS